MLGLKMTCSTKAYKVIQRIGSLVVVILFRDITESAKRCYVVNIHRLFGLLSSYSTVLASVLVALSSLLFLFFPVGSVIRSVTAAPVVGLFTTKCFFANRRGTGENKI